MLEEIPTRADDLRCRFERRTFSYSHWSVAVASDTLFVECTPLSRRSSLASIPWPTLFMLSPHQLTSESSNPNNFVIPLRWPNCPSGSRPPCGLLLRIKTGIWRSPKLSERVGCDHDRYEEKARVVGKELRVKEARTNTTALSWAGRSASVSCRTRFCANYRSPKVSGANTAGDANWSFRQCKFILHGGRAVL